MEEQDAGGAESTEPAYQDDDDDISSLGEDDSITETVPANAGEERAQRNREARALKHVKKEARREAADQAREERRSRVLEKQEGRRIGREKRSAEKVAAKAARRTGGVPAQNEECKVEVEDGADADDDDLATAAPSQGSAYSTQAGLVSVTPSRAEERSQHRKEIQAARKAKREVKSEEAKVAKAEKEARAFQKKQESRFARGAKAAAKADPEKAAKKHNNGLGAGGGAFHDDGLSVACTELDDYSVSETTVSRFGGSSGVSAEGRSQRRQEAQATRKAKRDSKLAEKQARALEKKDEKKRMKDSRNGGGKLTYMQSLADQAKSRFADEMAARYDAYVEKKRLYTVEDPMIPSALRGPARSMWDTMAPHFRNEFMAIVEAEIGLRKKRNTRVEHRRKSLLGSFTLTRECFCLTGDNIRNRILYALYPYDKTIWSSIRDPLWWGIFFLRCFPVFGISSFVFAGILALIDRSDQFQLTQFILVFKTFQFLVSGVVGLLYYSGWYSYCVVLEQPEQTSTCGNTGPGSFNLGALSANLIVFPMIAGFIAQIVLVWIALYLMRSSVAKGGAVRHGKRLIGDDIYWEEICLVEEENKPDCEQAFPGDDILMNGALPKKKMKKIVKRMGRVVSFERKTGTHCIALTLPGSTRAVPLFSKEEVQLDLKTVRYFVIDEQGPLQHLLEYDLFCFLVICCIAGLMLLISDLQGSLNRDWQVRAVLIGMQVGYSLCAFPFAFASIEPWKWVFTHARETGYNTLGVCVTKMPADDYPWVREANVEVKKINYISRPSLKGKLKGFGLFRRTHSTEANEDPDSNDDLSVATAKKGKHQTWSPEVVGAEKSDTSAQKSTLDSSGGGAAAMPRPTFNRGVSFKPQQLLGRFRHQKSCDATDAAAAAAYSPSPNPMPASIHAAATERRSLQPDANVKMSPPPRSSSVDSNFSPTSSQKPRRRTTGELMSYTDGASPAETNSSVNKATKGGLAGGRGGVKRMTERRTWSGETVGGSGDPGRSLFRPKRLTARFEPSLDAIESFNGGPGSFDVDAPRRKKHFGSPGEPIRPSPQSPPGQPPAPLAPPGQRAPRSSLMKKTGFLDVNDPETETSHPAYKIPGKPLGSELV